MDLTESTGVHHRHISAQALADIFIGGTQFVFEQFQSEQHPGRHRGPAPLGALFGEALGKAVLHSLNQGLPRKGVSPQADGVCFWDELGGQKLRTASDQPMLQVTQDTHKWLSYWPWPGRASEYDGMHSETTRHLQTKGAIKLVPTRYTARYGTLATSACDQHLCNPFDQRNSFLCLAARLPASPSGFRTTLALHCHAG